MKMSSKGLKCNLRIWLFWVDGNVYFILHTPVGRACTDYTLDGKLNAVERTIPENDFQLILIIYSDLKPG